MCIVFLGVKISLGDGMIRVRNISSMCWNF